MEDSDRADSLGQLSEKKHKKLKGIRIAVRLLTKLDKAKKVRYIARLIGLGITTVKAILDADLNLFLHISWEWCFFRGEKMAFFTTAC